MDICQAIHRKKPYIELAEWKHADLITFTAAKKLDSECGCIAKASRYVGNGALRYRSYDQPDCVVAGAVRANLAIDSPTDFVCQIQRAQLIRTSPPEGAQDNESDQIRPKKDWGDCADFGAVLFGDWGVWIRSKPLPEDRRTINQPLGDMWK